VTASAGNAVGTSCAAEVLDSTNEKRTTVMVARIDLSAESSCLNRDLWLFDTSATTSGTQASNTCTDCEHGEGGGFRDSRIVTTKLSVDQTRSLVGSNK
jgi:hypothetical protein